jgi:DNA-binding PadR family transcriptional regulator
MAAPRFGRYAEASLWILATLLESPRSTQGLVAELRYRPGRIGPGTLFGAIARLEAAALVDRVVTPDGSVHYRLAGRPAMV